MTDIKQLKKDITRAQAIYKIAQKSGDPKLVERALDVYKMLKQKLHVANKPTPKN